MKKTNPQVLPETLKLVNKIRKEMGKAPLKKMPRGHTGDSENCPIHNAIAPAGSEAVSIGATAVCHDKSLATKIAKALGRKVIVTIDDYAVRLPKPMQQFISKFDAGEYPQLQKKEW
jgi:imidazole glycerol phosphate synthase subunit HisF